MAANITLSHTSHQPPADRRPIALLYTFREEQWVQAERHHGQVPKSTVLDSHGVVLSALGAIFAWGMLGMRVSFRTRCLGEGISFG